MILKQLSFLFLLSISCFSFSQQENIVPSKLKKVRKTRPSYFNISVGVNSTNLRDFATSPLTYSGPSALLDLSYFKIDSTREANYGTALSIGQLRGQIGEFQAGTSTAGILSIYYDQLYQITKWSSKKWNIKAGGSFNFTGTLRDNPSLQNNRTGSEFFFNLLGSAKLTRDLTTYSEKKLNFIVFRYKLKPRVRSLSYQLNIGLLNSSYRNGFAFIGQSSVLNDPKVFDGYEFNLFSGFKINSSLTYHLGLINKNEIAFSYHWEAIKTGGDLDKFDLAQHSFRFTLLFNTK